MTTKNGRANIKHPLLRPLSVLAVANESSALLLLSQSEARVSPDGDAPRILRPRLGPLRPYEAPRPRGESHG